MAIFYHRQPAIKASGERMRYIDEIEKSFYTRTSKTGIAIIISALSTVATGISYHIFHPEASVTQGAAFALVPLFLFIAEAGHQGLMALHDLSEMTPGAPRRPRS